jgi:hypothetical protein
MSTRARMPDLHLPHLRRRFRQAQQEPQLELHRHRRHRGHEDARCPIGRSLPLSPQEPSLKERPRLQRRGRRREQDLLREAQAGGARPRWAEIGGESIRLPRRQCSTNDHGGFHSDSKLGALGAHDAQLPCRERPLLCPREPGLRGTHEEDARSFACIMLNGSC